MHLSIDVANMTGRSVRLTAAAHPDTLLQTRSYERLELSGDTTWCADYANSHTASSLDLFFRNAGVRAARVTLTAPHGTPQAVDLQPGDSRRLQGPVPLDLRIQPVP